MIETLAGLALAAGHDFMDQRSWLIPTLENPAVPLAAFVEGRGQDSAIPWGLDGAGTRFTAVWAAIRILSGLIARTPCRPMRTLDGGLSWEEDRSHYLWPVLAERWNESMTAYRAKRLMQAWLLRDGNAYAVVDYSPANGRVRELLPLRPDRVEFRAGRFFYASDSAGIISYPAQQVLHLRGMEFDGVKGISPLAHFRRTIGTALAQEEHQARFYANGARPGGVLYHPEHLEADTKAAMMDSWQRGFGGVSNAHRVAILDEGVKYEPVSMNMVDAEFIATRKFSIADVSRIYGVPLHMLAELERSTNNNIEHQGLELERYSAADHISNWEAELSDMLLSREERRQVTIEFDSERIHSPDMESRVNTAKTAVQGGVMTPDEARRRFGMRPAAGGDRLYMQQQMVPLEQPRGRKP